MKTTSVTIPDSTPGDNNLLNVHVGNAVFSFNIDEVNMGNALIVAICLDYKMIAIELGWSEDYAYPSSTVVMAIAGIFKHYTSAGWRLISHSYDTTEDIVTMVFDK